MKVKFDEQTTRFIESQVASGQFRSRSAVVREALRLHEQKHAKLMETASPVERQDPIAEQQTQSLS